jgi:hypothetical protein
MWKNIPKKTCGRIYVSTYLFSALEIVGMPNTESSVFIILG